MKFKMDYKRSQGTKEFQYVLQMITMGKQVQDGLQMMTRGGFKMDLQITGN